MANDSKIGISLVIKAIDEGSPVLQKISGFLDKIGLSSTTAGGKADAAGNQIKNAFSAIPDHLDKMNKSVENFSNKLSSMGASLTALGASITAPMGLAVKTAADFETEMNKLQAFGEIDIKTDAGQKAFQAATDKARELGATTQFTAAEVAAGMGELYKAGFKTEEVLASIGPALNLAFTEGRSMKDTAEDLVKVLASFGMSADQAGRATDVLSKTSLATTTSMGGLVEGLKYVASLANNVGMNIEETTAYLGIFAQNGVDASMAGTGLRRLLGELSNPSKEAAQALAVLDVQIAKNKDGSVNLTKTFEALKASGLTTANAFKIFGDIGGNVAITATKNIDAIKKLTVENENSAGSLNKVVGIINKGLAPAWKNFLSALQEVAIALAGPFLEALKGALDRVSAFLRGVSEFSKAHPIITQAITAIVASFGLLAAAAGTVTLGLAGLTYAAKIFGSVLAGSSLLSLGSIVAAIIPSWTALTAAIGSFISALGTAGTAIAAFASGPVALFAAAVAAILGTVAGAWKVLSDRAEAAEIQAETLKRSQADLQRAIREGFDPNKALQSVSGADLKNDPYVDLVEKRKKAVAAFVGINEQLTQAREKDAQSWLPGKSAETSAAEKGVALARQNLDLIQAEINGRIGQRAEVEGLIVAHEKLNETKKQEILTSEQLLTLAKNRSDVELKLIADSIKDKENALKLETDSRKIAIEQNTKSAVMAEQQINSMVVSSSQERIALAEQEYIAVRTARERGFSEQRAVYEGMLKSGENVSAAKKGLAEIEKAETELQIADQKKLSEAILQEAQNQLKAKSDAVRKIRDLEKELRDEQTATQDALKKVTGAYLSEYAQLDTKLFDVNQKFKDAINLIPTMPEKAMELFKQVKNESAGLVQNIESINAKLRNVANIARTALRAVDNFGKEGADKYKATVQDLYDIGRRANEATAGGRFGEAEQLYNQMIQGAQQLPSQVDPKDAKAVEDAKALAKTLISFASGGMTDALTIQKRQAEEANERARQLLEASQRQIEKLIGAQIDSANALIEALNTNTAALLSSQQSPGQPGQPGQSGQQTGGTGGTSTTPSQPITYTPYAEGAASRLGGDYTPMPRSFDAIGRGSGSISNSPEVAALLAKTDALLAQSRADSAVMDARMDALKYLESNARNLDRKQQTGYFGQLGPQDLAQPGFGNGMGDFDINEALQKIFGTDRFNFDGMKENVDRMLGNMTERARSTLDRYQSSRNNVDSSQFQPVADALVKEISGSMSGQFSGIGSEIAEQLMQGVKDATPSGFDVDITVADNRSTDATITRIG